MKRLHILTPHFAPENNAAAQRLNALAITLSKRFDVHVYTLSARGVKPLQSESKIADGLTVHATYLPAYSKRSFAWRAIVELFYSFRLAFIASRQRCDLAIVTTPFMFMIPAGVFFLRGTRRWLDIRDITWSYLPSRTVFQRLVKNLLRRLMNTGIRSYERIWVTNEAERRIIEQQASVPASRISVLSNGISRYRFDRLTTVRYHEPEHPFVITYIGNVGDGQDLRPLLFAVKDMPHVKVQIIGDGIDWEAIRDLVRSENIKNVRLFGAMNWTRILPYYQTSSLLFGRLSMNYRTAVPSKLYEYLATGLPILFQGRGEAVRMLQGFENTYIVEEENSQVLRRTIQKLIILCPERSYPNILTIQENFVRETVLNAALEDLLEALGEATESTYAKEAPQLEPQL